jgi:hypothetical protein
MRRHDIGASSRSVTSDGSTPEDSSIACAIDGADLLSSIARRLVLTAATRGVGHSPVRAIVSSDGRTAAPGLGDWFVPYGLALGVGHDEDPVTSVRGADGGSGYAVPLRVIPARGQVAEYVSHSPSKETRHVLQQHPVGS